LEANKATHHNDFHLNSGIMCSVVACFLIGHVLSHIYIHDWTMVTTGDCGTVSLRF